jgi:UDP-glucuronate decarboxylase
MKRVIVTGGAGFLGSHLCEKLLNEGHFVYCIDNLFTGSKKNIFHLMNSNRFEFINHDVTFPFYSLRVDQIYNLACPASPLQYQYDPIQTAKTSFLGALNMLGLAKRTGATILQASTSEIYGNPEQHPQTEEYWGNVNPIGIRSCYDEGKRMAECLFFDYYRQHGVKIKIARIFNTYGPRMDENDGRVVSNFIVQSLKNEKITIYGSGDQTRCFCYVDDMIDGLYRLMNSGNEISGPINLGNPVEVTVRELAEIIREKTNSQSPLVFQNLPVDDPKQRKPDISRAINILQWHPKISLHDGLNRTIEYFNV